MTTIRTAVNEIGTTDLWKQCDKHVIEKENEYCVLPPINPLIISLNSDDSSPESDDDDDDV